MDEVGLAAAGRANYLPSPWRVLARILDPVEITPRDVFMDFGCGMGLVLLEAAERYPFRRVIGVDIVPQFTEAARNGVARNLHRLQCRDIEVITADAAQYEVPNDVTVAYLYDPFFGSVLDAVISNLIASVDRSPRTLRIIYLGPREATRLERMSRVRFVRFGRRGVRRWAASDNLLMTRSRRTVPQDVEPATRPHTALGSIRPVPLSGKTSDSVPAWPPACAWGPLAPSASGE